jgi:hypothetical protein
MKVKLLAGATLAFLSMGLAAYANPTNLGPPPGAILDLNGLPITNSQQSYSVDFVSAVEATAITFAFRQDPSFESFSNASVVDVTTGSGNLLVDGDFSLGTPGSNSPPGWTYANMYGATYGGVVENGCGVGGSNCWYDGAVQAYDAISQTIITTVGDTYEISFNLNGGGSQDGIYSRISTNGDVTDTGGNGIDVLAYAQDGLPPPPPMPEPATWVLMMIGVGGVGGALRSVRRRAPAAA